MQTRIAIIGGGGVARRHAAVLGGFADVQLVGVTDVVAAAGTALAHEAATVAFDSLGEMLDATDPDAVYVCVPPFAHGEAEWALVQRGIPFFVEKPLAAEPAVAEALAQAVAERGLLTATGYHWRYMANTERARQLLAGTPARLAVGAWLDKVPPVAWWTRRDRSGGQVVEQATHLLDLMLDLVGDVDQVYAIASHAPREALPDADIDDVTSATLRFAGGAVGSLTATSLLRAKHRAGLELFCDGRRLELTETALVVEDGQVLKTPEDPWVAKRRVDRAFVDAVQGHGDDVRAAYGVALRTHRVACAIARSALDGTPVDLAGAS
ncbi:MAG: putative oxidoreductase [Solirubrobacterales bacterium]|nr:putative oxidoreductase [Solirubrobacterales bacterium]